MELIERLYDDAVRDGITVETGDIPVDGMDAAYVSLNGKPYICIRQDGSRAQRTCWLAEELGHHATGSDRVLHYDKIDDWKAEARARRWAHNKLLSADAIRTAALHTDDIFEIADALGVSVPFLVEAIDDLMSRGLWSPIYSRD